MVSTFLMPSSLVGMSLIGRLESRTWPANNAGNVVPGLLAPPVQARVQKSHDSKGNRKSTEAELLHLFNTESLPDPIPH